MRSDLINSVNTCIAPCIESVEPEERRLMRAVSRSGYSSGQSQFAIDDRVYAYCRATINRTAVASTFQMNVHIAIECGD